MSGKKPENDHTDSYTEDDNTEDNRNNVAVNDMGYDCKWCSCQENRYL